MEKIEEAAKKSGKKHPVVFISGLGGAGKTTLAKKIAGEIPNTQILEMDWYLIQTSRERRERIKNVFGENNENTHLIDSVLDPINWYDWENFRRDLKKLQEEGKLEVKNAWVQPTGEKDGEFNLDFKGEGGLIISEGIFMLHPGMKELADFSIFIDPPKMEARAGAEERDRNKSDQEHLERKKIIMEKYDIPYYEKYKSNADVIINSIV